MRRKDREVTDVAAIEKLIANSVYLHLGMFDGDYPYIVPMHYAYKMEEGKLTFYMHSAKEGHKLDCLKANSNVFVGIDSCGELIEGKVACSYGAKFESVMCRGTASFLEAGEEKNNALALLMKQQTGRDFEISDQMAAAIEVIKVDVASYTAKVNA